MSTSTPMRPLLRDQLRARDAYRHVRDVPAASHNDYRILVQGLGPSILRLGLAGTLSRIEANKSPAARRLLDDLASFAVVGIKRVPGARLPHSVRELPADTYMLATREFLQVATWLRRAVQALLSAPSSEESAHAK